MENMLWVSKKSINAKSTQFISIIEYFWLLCEIL